MKIKVIKRPMGSGKNNLLPFKIAHSGDGKSANYLWLLWMFCFEHIGE